MKFKRYFPMLLGATTILPMTVVACSNNSEDKSKIDELNKEIEKHKKDADDLLATKNGLEATLNEKEAKLTELNGKIDLLTKQLQDKITDDEKEQLNKQLLKDKVALENQINELNKEVKNHKDAKEQLTSQLNEKTNVINELNQKIELLTKQKEDGDKSNKDALDKLDKEKKALEAELKTQKTAKDELSNQLNEKNNSINELNKKVESLTKQLQSNTNETLEQLKRDKASLEAEIKSLRNNSHTSENGSKEYVLLKKIADFYKSEDKNAKLELNLNLRMKTNWKSVITKSMVENFKADKQSNGSITEWYRDKVSDYNDRSGQGEFVYRYIFQILKFLKDKNNEEKVNELIKAAQNLSIDDMLKSLILMSNPRIGDDFHFSNGDGDWAMLMLTQYLLFGFDGQSGLEIDNEKLPEYSKTIDINLTNLNQEQLKNEFDNYISYQSSIVEGYNDYLAKEETNNQGRKEELSKKLDEIKNDYTVFNSNDNDTYLWNKFREKVAKLINEVYKRNNSIELLYNITNPFEIYNLNIIDIKELATALPEFLTKVIPVLGEKLFNQYSNFQGRAIFKNWFTNKYHITDEAKINALNEKDSYINAIRQKIVDKYKHWHKASEKITKVNILGVYYEIRNPENADEMMPEDNSELNEQFTDLAMKLYNDSLRYFFTDFLTTDSIIKWSEAAIDLDSWGRIYYSDIFSDEEQEENLTKFKTIVMKNKMNRTINEIIEKTISLSPQYKIREKLNINLKVKLVLKNQNITDNPILDALKGLLNVSQENVQFSDSAKLKISDEALKVFASYLKWLQRENSPYSISISEE
ncbi:hypothetical protein [Mycoplasma sp. Z244C]